MAKFDPGLLIDDAYVVVYPYDHCKQTRPLLLRPTEGFNAFFSLKALR